MKCFRRNGWKITCVNQDDMDAVAHLVGLDYPLYPRETHEWDHPMPAGVEGVHGGNRANVFKAEIDGKNYCVKVFHDRRFHVRLRNCCGFSKAWKSFKNGLRLMELNIPVPRVIAFAKGGFCGPQIFVLEFLGKGETVRTAILKGVDTEPLMGKCAVFTRLLAGNGIFHKDYGARNILLSGERLLLIDLEDVTFNGHDRSRLEAELRDAFLAHLERNSLKAEGF